MRVGALIERLEFLRRQYGELDVVLSSTSNGLMEIGIVDLDDDAPRIIIWEKAEE